MKTALKAFALTIALVMVAAPAAQAEADASTETLVAKEKVAAKKTKKPASLKWVAGEYGHNDVDGKVYCFEAQNRTRKNVKVYASTSGPSKTAKTLKPWHWLIYCTDGWAEQQRHAGLDFI